LVSEVPVRRQYSVFERIGLLGVAIAGAAVVWPPISGATGFMVPCLLRWSTGVPCPGCGLTTASVALVRGDIAGSFAANPAILGVTALAVVMLPLLGLRAIGVAPAPVPWSARARSRMGWTMALLAVASWVFQLNRLGIG
jgi:hypothetical protein